MKVNLLGGLGGQMQLYAFGRSVSLAKGFPLYFDKSQISNDPQRKYVLDDYDLDIQLGGPDGPVYQERGPRFEPEVYDVTDPNTHFEGYFFTHKYFNDAVVRKEFARPKATPSDENLRIASKITLAKHSAFVHIRRGDHLWAGVKEFHGLMRLEYYIAGMQQITARFPDTQFFIFSDDPAWCRSQFAGTTCTVIEQSDSECWDLWLMSLCDSAVITNSVFGWWGAWLNPDPKKIVIAPKPWYAGGTDGSDTVPESWVQIPAEFV